MGKSITIALIAGIFIVAALSSCHGGKQAGAGSQGSKEYSEALSLAKQTLPVDITDDEIIKFKTVAEGITKPKAADDFFLIAYYADLNDNSDSAKKYYSKVIQLKPDYAEAHLNMGTLYAYEKDADNAIKFFEKAIELKPDNKNNAYSCIVLGYLYYNKENYTKGDEYFGKVIEYMDDKAEANFGLGVFYYQDMEDTDKAMEYYKKAIELKPDYTAAYIHMGYIHYEKQDYEKAIENSKKVIELEPSNAEAYLNIAASMEKMHNCRSRDEWQDICNKEIEYYKKGAELKPQSATAYFNLGLLYEQKGDYKQAVEYLGKTVDLDQKNAYAYFRIGYIYTHQGNYKQAIDYYERVIELDPSDVEAYGGAAYAYLKEKEHDQAIEYYKKAVELNFPGTCRYYNNMGIAHFFKRDNSKAAEYFKMAIELWPKCASPYNNMGEISFYEKDYDKTIEYCQKAIELDSTLAESYYYLGEAFYKKGDKKKGAEYRKKSDEMGYVYESPEAKKVPLESPSEKLKKKFTDSRDGKTYKYVQIGKQTWMSENLNHKAENSWCYNDNDLNCGKYGRIYDWASATKVCPSGWHLPSKEEWETLIDFAGGKENASEKLKAQSGWDRVKVWNEKKKLKEVWKGNGSDDFGFSALPGGARISSLSGGKPAYYDDFGTLGSWWTATEYEEGGAWRIVMDLSYDNAVTLDAKNKNVLGFSVRCVKN